MSFFINKGGSNGGGGSGSGGTTIINNYENYVVNTISERDVITSKPGNIAFVIDASGDPTVTGGWAVYQKIDDAWVKISSQEGGDIDAPSTQAFNQHTQSVASDLVLGHVKVDGVTISITQDGTISANIKEATDATLLAKGIVQLSNALDLNSDNLAATPKAVKDAIEMVKSYTDTELLAIVGGATESYNTLNKISLALQDVVREVNDVKEDILEHVSDVDSHVTKTEKDRWNAGANIYVGPANQPPADMTLIWATVIEED